MATPSGSRSASARFGPGVWTSNRRTRARKPCSGCGILYESERNSGNDVRRVGEEGVEALRNYREKVRKVPVKKLLEFARICRVEKVMRPYLEAVL